MYANTCILHAVDLIVYSMLILTGCSLYMSIYYISSVHIVYSLLYEDNAKLSLFIPVKL